MTKTAETDINTLRLCGYSPTDAEVVELNDLARRIEAGKETTPANCPRFAFAGNIILHEPTLMGEMWWIDYGKDAFFLDKWRLYTYFFMLCNSQNEELKTLQKGSDIRKEVKKWARTCGATERELWRALMWVKYANEDAIDDVEQKVRTSLDDEETRTRLWMTLISASGALGVSPDDLETKTRSELDSLLVKANLMARIPMKQSIANDYIAYRQILKRIEERGMKNG